MAVPGVPTVLATFSARAKPSASILAAKADAAPSRTPSYIPFCTAS